MPEIYLEKPSLILIPPEVAGYLGIHIEVSFIQSPHIQYVYLESNANSGKPLRIAFQ
jgi:hypothetical protein